MRKLYHFLLLVGGGFLLSGNFAGCSSDKTNDDPSGPDSPEVPQISVSLTNSAAMTTSIELRLETSGITEYAWMVVEGEVTTLPKPEIIFANAQENGQTATAKDGINTIELKGLNGNTKYTVFVAPKSADGYEEVQSLTFSTSGYTQMVTITDVQQFGLTFHIKMDAGKYYKWGLWDVDTYQGMREYGAGDCDLLAYGFPGQGEQTVTLVDGKMVDGSDPVDEFDTPVSIKPGYAYVLLLGECDADGNMLFEATGGGGDLGVLSTPVTRSFPDDCIGEYTENCTDDWYRWTGLYAKQKVSAAPPTPGPSEVKIKMTAQTAMRVTFHLTPTSDMIGYSALTMPVSEWESWVEVFGEYGARAMLTQYSGGMLDDETDIEATDLIMGEKYYLLVLSTFSQDYSVQTFQKVPFEAKNSTMPVPEVVITGIDAPADSDYKGPYYVWFNIKAPNKDLGSAKYSCEYTKNWIATLNGGEESLNTLFSKYGVPLGADVIASINSDAGYNISFSSWENTESRLYIQAFNSDEVSKIYWGASTSPEEPAKERVESSLFDDLLGDWTAVYKNSAAQAGTKFKVTIAAAPECPTGEIPSDVKTRLVEYYKGLKGISEAEAEALVQQEYQNFRSRAQRFGEKYREQNRLVCRGFEYSSSSYSKLGYQSPWDLFGDTSYSAYATDDLFFDYGSKWFFEIGKESDGSQSVRVATNPYYIAPLQNCGRYEYHLGFRSGNYEYFALDFPVVVSDDKNTLTVQGLKLQNTDGEETFYYPSVCYLMSGFVMSSATGTDNIVLTRGWSDDDASQQSARRVQRAEPQNGRNHRFYRTKLFYDPQNVCKKVVIKPVTELPRSEKAARMAARLQK